MADFNDYKWYEEENSNEPVSQPFYMETVKKTKKGRAKKAFKAVAVGLCLAVTLSSVATTAYVLKNGAVARTSASRVVSVGNSDSAFGFEKMSDSDRKAMTTVEIAANVAPAVVGISCVTQGYSFFGQVMESSSSGSGVIITDDGYVVTNNHVIEGAKKITVVLNTGKEYEAKVVGTDAKTDLAVLKVEATELPAVTLGDSDTCQVGELAVAIGNPLGQELAGTVTVGVVSAVNRTIEMSNDGSTMTLIQTDAAINPGNSGGALVNAYGELIGINSMKFSGSNVEGIGFAIPVNTAKPVISDLMKEGYVKGRPLIGISIREVTPDVAAINDMPSGLYVAYVAEDGAADRAGIRQGDIITSVEGVLVESVKEINEIRDKHKAGDTISIGVNRDGEAKTFSVTLLEDTSSRGSN